MGVALAGVSIPNFVLGPLLVLGFSLTLYLLPPALWQGPRSRILPVLTLSTAYVAYIARLTRAGMLEVLRQDFVRTARAKGLAEHDRRGQARAQARDPAGGVLHRAGGGARRSWARSWSRPSSRCRGSGATW